MRPVVRFIRMKYTRQQLDEIARHLLATGHFFYRHEFVWGFTPAFRNTAGTEFYFIAGHRILTPREMYAHLVRTWVPVTPEERMFFQNRLTAHFASLPQTVPPWTGVSVAEMIEETCVVMQDQTFPNGAIAV